MLLERLDNQAPSQHPDLPEKPSATARRFFYDTVSHGSHAAILCAWKAFGADHIVAGSDYPVLMPFETYHQTFHYIREAGLPPEDVTKILDRNAQRYPAAAVRRRPRPTSRAAASARRSSMIFWSMVSTEVSRMR